MPERILQWKVVKPRQIAKWKYLEQIKNELNLNCNVKIGLLIEANCSRVLKPEMVIHSECDGPYTFRAVLGWCNVGPISQKNAPGEKICNRTAVIDAGTGNIARHHFKTKIQVEESDLKQIIERMYQVDFSEPKLGFKKVVSNLEEVSFENHHFLKLLDNGTKLVNGYYQVPLPFKNPNVCFLDNKGQGMKRLKHLERLFAKNPSFFEHYKIFIEDMIKRGYARVPKQKPEKGKNWYIPHHCVYHPAKLDKIRVVLDCSAEQQGTSINKLMLGPDLANQIIGALF